VGRRGIRPDCHATWIGVLDHGSGWLGEVRHQGPGRLGVEQVVVRQLQALPLPSSRDAAAVDRAIKRGGLVRVFAVAKVSDLVPAQSEIERERLRYRAVKVIRNGG